MESVVPITNNFKSEVVDSELSKLSGYVVVKLKARAKSKGKPMHTTSKFIHTDALTGQVSAS